MLKLRPATATEISRFYSALKIDFDSRELFSLRSIQRAVRRGDQEFLLFYDEETGLTQGYALCGIRNVYGYVLLKYFGIFSWYQGHGLGGEAMRLLHKRYADRQGILAELTVFDDNEGGDYMRKLKRFFARFGYEEVSCGYRLGGAEVFLTAKPIRGTAEIASVAKRIVMDFYSRFLRPSQLDKMLVFTK